jgi:hypothetical protein
MMQHDDFDQLDLTEFEPEQDDDSDAPQPRGACSYVLFLAITVLVVIAVLISTYSPGIEVIPVEDGTPRPTSTPLPRADLPRPDARLVL